MNIHDLEFAVRHGFSSGSSDPQVGTVWIELNKIEEGEWWKIIDKINEALTVKENENAERHVVQPGGDT
jgi:hypothetical protein